MFNLFKKKLHTKISLEIQLESLSNLGISLEPGITIDDLLNSFAREEYENKPYDLVLGMLGSDVESEPWHRPFSSNIWDCDFERIYQSGDYVEIVEKLSKLAELSDSVTELKDHIDFDNNNAWLKYKIDGNEKHYKIKLDNDWIDSDALDSITLDLEKNGNHFYAINCGQASLFLYLNAESSRALKKLTGRKLIRWNFQ